VVAGWALPAEVDRSHPLPGGPTKPVVSATLDPVVVSEIVRAELLHRIRDGQPATLAGFREAFERYGTAEVPLLGVDADSAWA
jgi:hypothetical protein